MSSRQSLSGRGRSEDRAPVVVAERITLVAFDQQVVRNEIDLHVGFEAHALHIRQAIDVRQQEPCTRRGQEVVDHVAFRQAAGRHHDRVDVVVCRARTEFRLGKADRDGLQRRRDNKTTTAGEDLQASLILEVRPDRDHRVQKRSFVKINLNSRRIRNGAAVDRVRRAQQRNAVAANRGIIRRRRVKNIRAIDLLGLLERFHQAEV